MGVTRKRMACAAIRATAAMLALAAPWGGAGRSTAAATYPTAPQITDRDAAGQIAILLEDWVSVPKSGATSTSQVARANFIRAEPVASLAAARLFINDLNGTVYIFDRATQGFTGYLDFPSIFDGSGGTGVFDNSPGLAAGVVTVQFDPDYANNGKFYTVHTELGGNPTSYREGVLYEWQDTDISDTVFQGAQALLLRVQYTSNIHPIGDIIFNPLATSDAHPDWRNMYIASGDGAAGESLLPSTRNQTQMLNNLLGKILRILPSASGTPGTYAIPPSNPFTAPPYAPGARGEVYAYGFRNPHRLSWDVDPQDPSNQHLIVDDIGLHSWEEVNVVRSGENYGYSRIEGHMVLGSLNQVNSNPLPATLPIYTDTTSSSVGDIVPTYPPALYSHEDGDAVSSGFVYRGARMPQLRGKYVFGDIPTGRLFYFDLEEMLAADDSDPETTVEIHELKVFYSSPYDGAGVRERRVFDIVRDTFDRRNETAVGSVLHNGTVDDDGLPGGSSITNGNDPYGVPYDGGRADIRWARIDDELVLITKSDGMIRTASGCVPDESMLLEFGADKQTLSWAAPAGNPAGLTYDVVRGQGAGLPVGAGAGEVCIESAVALTATTDSDVPANGAAYWYVVRGRTACGIGSYGSARVGGVPVAERVTPICP